MRELVTAIPDADILLALEPEELAGKLLFIIRANGGKAHPGGFEGDLFADRHGTPPYPREKRDQIMLALSEAWSWLESQGLLVPEDGWNGSNGWRVLSRRARRMENHVDFSNFKTARMLSRDALHPTIAERVWSSFIRGEYVGAALFAMKGVEVAVREAAGYGNDRYGVKMMRDAFHPETGPLADMGTEPSERNGRSDIFAGAYASYRNPLSHQDINLENPAEALEIIFLANHLLRIIDARKAASGTI